ncbi:MAG: acetate--CoA ligase [Chlamydiae bacterium]|nr:acetate--CoA ligase [Chlamydiota bacterium]
MPVTTSTEIETSIRAVQDNYVNSTFTPDAGSTTVEYWEKEARRLFWFSPWEKTLNWHPPYAQWFIEGKTNASYNCLDIHLSSETRNKAAILWEGEDGELRSLTYQELHKEVCKLSNALLVLGVQKGDRVILYLPMIPEAIVSMLACARIGAIHVVVFAGFSSDSLKDRIRDAEAKIVITCDAGKRKGNLTPLKEQADAAIQGCPSVKNVIVVKRSGCAVNMQENRDVFYDSLISNQSEESTPQQMDAEDILFILYTSGTTGKPKGIIHTTGGYMVAAKSTTRIVFDIKPDDVYFCTADIGWITGHTYVVYGPLSNGMTVLMYEGSPDFPSQSRYWDLIEKHKATILYTAPTAIRTFIKWGDQWPAMHDLSSLRLLGSVGEPINPEAWLWYFKTIGKEKCPIVDTWWQTETGSIMISALPGITPLKPASATKPLPGIEAQILDMEGNANKNGFLAITSPWPSMLRGIYKDPIRYETTYWSRWNGQYYLTGDGASIDEDGYFWIMGRIDDVINVSGHRLGTMEIESALVEHHDVAEAAAIGVQHPIKGQGIVTFVSLKERASERIELEQELKAHVAKKIGSLARPEKVLFIKELPKTRSGKIMRRLLRDIAEGKILGDTSTLSDPSVIVVLKQSYEQSTD